VREKCSAGVALLLLAGLDRSTGIAGFCVAPRARSQCKACQIARSYKRPAYGGTALQASGTEDAVFAEATADPSTQDEEAPPIVATQSKLTPEQLHEQVYTAYLCYAHHSTEP
jgi:hypothetical protein